ncbi:MAG: stress responsive protein [Bacteroidetes bacterium]|nr:MAG: stress responsive protein [Bacteroidota bacterium]
MKSKLLFSSIALAILAIAVLSFHQKEEKMLRHVVIFKFKDGTTADQIKTVEDAFRALPSKVSEIKGFEWGTNNSPENLAQGYTHCFLVTFASEKDRDAYLPHPAHKAFIEKAGPFIEKAFVIDYWASK